MDTLRGAFTGAYDEKPGLFEEADGGTLLLDEIATMEPSLQVKLLRILDTGEMRRVGETVPRHVSVRILAATNVDPDVAMENGLFRKDLYYRLNVMHIEVPPLRERKEDIIPLVEHFVDIFNKKMGLKISHISRDAREALLKCPWKGNVRELQNVVERAMILTRGRCDYSGMPSERYSRFRPRRTNFTGRGRNHVAQEGIQGPGKDPYHQGTQPHWREPFPSSSGP